VHPVGSAPPLLRSVLADTIEQDTTEQNLTEQDAGAQDTLRPAATEAPARPDTTTALLDTTTARPDTAVADTVHPVGSAPPLLRSVLADTIEQDTTEQNLTEQNLTEQDAGAQDTLRPAATEAPTRPDTTTALLDTTTVRPDTAVADTAHRVREYLDPFYRRRGRTPYRRSSPFLTPRPDPWAAYDVSLDSTSNRYLARRFNDVGLERPMAIDSTTFRSTQLRSNIDANWQALADQQSRQRNARQGLGVNIVVPGGRQSAFSTIFGKPQVDLRVNGQADINAGFDYRKSDQQVSLTGNASQVDPDFKQDLRLGITGTIGDKMQVDVDWDTNNQFEYQNQVKLQYTGYEDEIVQSIEAGNVFLETPSTLIRGGQSLFGIKSEFQLGNLSLTTVASQQEGQSQSLSIEGGSSETTEFNLKPTEYDDNTHFFLGYYFRNRWNPAHARPPNIVLANGFERITDIEVWKLRTTANPDQENVRKAVGMVDLGEPSTLLTQADQFTATTLPNADGSDDGIDQYDDQAVATLRDGDSPTTPGTYLENNVAQPLTSSDYQVGDFRKLERGRDYTFDEVLGYISLQQRLQDNEALAVAFRYQANGRTFTVGDLASEAGGTSGGQNADRLVLKLLRPANLKQPGATVNPAAWYLQLRNIYRLPGRGFNPDNFSLDIQYEPSGQASTTAIPELAGQTTLLQLLGLDGLDRLNQDGAPAPDDAFDYLREYTISPSEGYLIFPFLEPFGQRLADVIADKSVPSEQQLELTDQFVFRSLYRQKPENARLDQQLDIYRIDGEYKGSVQDFYDLRAFAGLVEGSVEVTAGGTPLQEGTDYTVDYQGGTVSITNPAYLTAGRDIQINYEQNSFANLQKKTLLGARANYALDDRFALGATVMRLSQQSPIDKFRIGEEPIQNTIWGLDGSLDLEPRWLTRTVDALPLVQTRAQSSLSLSGEFAQFRPGHTTTDAFKRAQGRLQDEGRNFSEDERNGISYIDDFEGFENTFSLRQPGTWRLSAPPVFTRRHGGDVPGLADDSLRTTWRGNFAWYQLNQNIVDQLGGKAESFDEEAARILNINEVFPERDVSGELDRSLTSLDLYFNPYQRGPYNYTTELEDFIRNPKDVWGGFTQRIPEGYTDFNLQNVEFVEFIFKPFPENAQRDAGRDARLHLDLGSISEDVIPNEKLNTEDGLSTTGFSERDLDPSWGRLPGGQENSAVDVDGDRTEDLGLDGVVSYDESAYPPSVTESERFRTFLDELPTGGAGLSGEQASSGRGSKPRWSVHAATPRAMTTGTSTTTAISMTPRCFRTAPPFRSASAGGTRAKSSTRSKGKTDWHRTCRCGAATRGRPTRKTSTSTRRSTPRTATSSTASRSGPRRSTPWPARGAAMTTWSAKSRRRTAAVRDGTRCGFRCATSPSASATSKTSASSSQSGCGRRATRCPSRSASPSWSSWAASGAPPRP
jgi:cell surface protein SprA